MASDIYDTIIVETKCPNNYDIWNLTFVIPFPYFGSKLTVKLLKKVLKRILFLTR